MAHDKRDCNTRTVADQLLTTPQQRRSKMLGRPRTDEEIIDVIGKALKKGESYHGNIGNYNDEIVLWDLYSLRLSKDSNNDLRIKFNALLEYLGLEFVSSPSDIVRKKKK